MSWQDILLFVGSGAAIPVVVGGLKWIVAFRGMVLAPATLRWVVYSLAFLSGLVATAVSKTITWGDPATLSMFMLAVFGEAETIYRVMVGKLLPESTT